LVNGKQIKLKKMEKFNFLFILLSIAIFGCKNSTVEQLKPDSIASYTVTPINGGGIISYNIPDDRNISYILAEYERNGKMFTERSSIYNNSVRIEGFSSLDKIPVTLRTVNHKEVQSDPITVEISPLEAPVQLIQQSLKMVTDFGGITTSWENKTGTEIGVRLMLKDASNKLKDTLMYYSYDVNGTHLFRGFNDTEQTFALCFEDKWGNISDTSYMTTTPYFEIEVAKPWTQITYIPNDNNTFLNSAMPFSKIYDGIKGGDNGYLTVSGSKGTSFTIDLKQQVKLSRTTVWTRWKALSDIFGQVNVLSFEMWGTDQIEMDKLSDSEYWADVPLAPRTTFKDKWTYLGKYYIIPPVVGTGSQEDANLAAAIAGFDFHIPINVAPVRYIRMFARSTGNSAGGPPVNNYYQYSELSFFGNNKIPQY
jgi:hypothetical protein